MPRLPIFLNDSAVQTPEFGHAPSEPSAQAKFRRRTDSRLPPSLSRVTPSAVSEHSSELLGCPISRSLATSCVGLELRLLPSTGITRLHKITVTLGGKQKQKRWTRRVTLPFDEFAEKLSRSPFGTKDGPCYVPATLSGEARKQNETVEIGIATAATRWKRSPRIYADPPWTFEAYSGKGKMKSAERHYDTASLDAIKALPVADLAADDCALFLWCTMPQIPEALEAIKAWGFSYKTVAFTWVKLNKSGNGIFLGLGYWTRANPEICLLATKGDPTRLAMDVRQVVMAPVGAHSTKPEEVRKRIERLLAGPYLELFARAPAEGWTVWGNEAPRSEAEFRDVTKLA
jgi:N6-adenosine-specific RNA methylase IME4